MVCSIYVMVPVLQRLSVCLLYRLLYLPFRLGKIVAPQLLQFAHCHPPRKLCPRLLCCLKVCAGDHTLGFDTFLRCICAYLLCDNAKKHVRILLFFRCPVYIAQQFFQLHFLAKNGEEKWYEQQEQKYGQHRVYSFCQVFSVHKKSPSHIQVYETESAFMNQILSGVPVESL